jgi:hypothetical protein
VHHDLSAGASWVELSGFRSLACFDLVILFAIISLSRNLDETGVNDLPGLDKYPLLIKGLVKAVEQRLDYLFPDQRFPEQPYCFAVRNSATGIKSKKSFEAESVVDLIFDRIIGKTVEALQDKNYEHQYPVKRGTASITAVLKYIERLIQDRPKYVPVYMLIKLDQRIFQLGQLFKKILIVKQARRVGVFHDFRISMSGKAIKYDFCLLDLMLSYSYL